MTTQIISPSGQKNNEFGAYDATQKYRQGDTIVYNGNVYTANDNIPANTVFAIGSTGATWAIAVTGFPSSGLSEIANGTSNVTVANNGNITINTDIGVNYVIDSTGITATSSASPAPYLSGFSSANLEAITVTQQANLGTIGNVIITGGSTGQVLSTDGLGGLSWVTSSSEDPQKAAVTTQLLSDMGSPSFVEIPTFAGTIREASNQTELNSAITASSDGDIISLTADITLTSTLVINKAVKITGGFIIQSAGTTSDPVTLISVTAAAYIDSTITIKHRKTTNTSVEVAVSTNTTGFCSDARVEFMEFGYILKGSWKITGQTVYTGALANNHRHIAIYSLTAPSSIMDVEFDFPQEATSRASFIYVSSNNAVTERFESVLRVSGCYHDLSKFCRQFFLMDVFNITGRNASIVIDNNRFDDVNGGIGLVHTDSANSPLNQFTTFAVYNNVQGTAGKASYKGLVFIDGSGTAREVGSPTIFMVSDNVAPVSLRVDYTWLVSGSVAFKNTLFTITTLAQVTFGTQSQSATFADVRIAGNISGNTAGFALGYRDVPQVTVAANATFALTDAGKHYYNTTAANFTLTVPNNTSVAYSTGTAISVVNQSANTLTIAQGTGVTMYMSGNATSGNRTLGSYGMATLMKVGTDTWFINGAGVA
jgi:hypothetical protein